MEMEIFVPHSQAEAENIEALADYLNAMFFAN